MGFKWNWGKGIFLFFTVYVLFLASFFFYTLTHQEGLITENYYEKDLKYQEHINRIKRTLELGESFSINYFPDKKALEIRFPRYFNYSEISGNVKLYRPSDIKMDFSVPVKIDSSMVMRVSTENIQPGYWKVKVNWKVGETEYYGEKSFTR